MPDDLAACQHALLEARGELTRVQHVLCETAAVCEEQHQELQRLKEELELLKRFRFGRRSERFVDPPGQGRLFEEPAEIAPAPAPDDPAQFEQIAYRRRLLAQAQATRPDHG